MKRTKKKEYGFVVLALDPSLRAFGWSVLNNNIVLKAGCIKTAPSNKKLRIRKGDDRCRRISEINDSLILLIKNYDVCYIVSEQPHGSQSSVSATALGIVLALIQTIGDCFEIGVEWFNEADSKKVMLNKSTGTKEEMIKAISKVYNVKWTNVGYIDEAIADSIAIYHTARKNSSTIKMMIK